MGRITDGMASSHAYALVDPTGWDHRRIRSRGRYAARFGVEPRAHPDVAAEVPEERERRLLSHAHAPILRRVLPHARVPVIPVFVNAIHWPAPSPGRCHRLGAAMREIIEGRPGSERVAVYASGGLSHFTADYPWEHYSGPCTVGSICEEFDRRAATLMRNGQGAELGRLTSRELVDHGAIELRSWITLLGAVSDVRPRFLHYQPFYSAVMAMGAGYWDLEAADG